MTYLYVNRKSQTDQATERQKYCTMYKHTVHTDRHKEKVFIETLYQFGTSSVQISHLLTQK